MEKKEDSYQKDLETFVKEGEQEVFDAGDNKFCEEQQYESNNPIRKNNRTVPIVLLVIIFGLLMLLFQKGRLVKLQEQGANAQAQIILLQEEALLQYDITPQMIPELFALREKWFNDHSSESAREYSEALGMMLDYLEKYSDFIGPPESIDSPQAVIVEL